MYASGPDIVSLGPKRPGPKRPWGPNSGPKRQGPNVGAQTAGPKRQGPNVLRAQFLFIQMPTEKNVNTPKKSKKKQELDQIEEVTKLYTKFDAEAISSGDPFSAFPLSLKTLKGLEDAKFTKPTDIQRLSLGHSILGKDVVGGAKTGSGKTLALIVPLLENLWRNRWTKTDGLGALIITPTRELAYQIYQMLNTVGKHHEFSVALLIGGTDVDFEKHRLAAVNIIICTPGRLLQHMDENEHFSCDQLQVLVIDEADRILDMGFRQQVRTPQRICALKRQTLLFSATQTRRTEDLVRVSLQDPVFVAAHEHCDKATPDQLVQSYFVCMEEDKLNMLWSFLKNNLKKKTLVFVTCCKQARFITQALSHLRPGLYFTGLWGDLKQNKRMEHFHRFDAATGGAAMVCTDVASRGLDFNGLDWVLQMDCPPTVDDYIHRVGRTARMNRKGEAMLMLTPSQEVFTTLLSERSVPINKVTVEPDKVFDVRNKINNLMIPNPSLKQFAQQSLVAYAKAVYFTNLKNVFDVRSIDFDALAKSYGLVVTPRIRFLRKMGMAPMGKSEANGKALPKLTMKTEQIVLGGMQGESNTENPFQIGGDTGCDDADDDVGDESFLKVSRRDVFSSISEVDVKEEVLSRISSKKPISKTLMAKKMIKRFGVVGKRKRFEDEVESDGEDDHKKIAC
uniref:ATP-dependent RNA helicase n=1 Tax=Globodera rostochiensis TaxID=31243 RepID=A0A914I6E5_GLORO